MLGDVVTSAAACAGSSKTTAVTAEVVLDCLAGQLGDGDSTPFSLVTQLGVELIGQLDRGSLHGMPAYLAARVEGRGFRLPTGSVSPTGLTFWWWNLSWCDQTSMKSARFTEVTTLCGWAVSREVLEGRRVPEAHVLARQPVNSCLSPLGGVVFLRLRDPCRTVVV